MESQSSQLLCSHCTARSSSYDMGAHTITGRSTPAVGLANDNCQKRLTKDLQSRFYFISNNANKAEVRAILCAETSRTKRRQRTRTWKSWKEIVLLVHLGMLKFLVVLLLSACQISVCHHAVSRHSITYWRWTDVGKSACCSAFCLNCESPNPDEPEILFDSKMMCGSNIRSNTG